MFRFQAFFNETSQIAWIVFSYQNSHKFAHILLFPILGGGTV